MSVTIRLRRMGKKKQPHYRIVATDSRFPRDGRFVENLGYYNPIPDPAKLSVDLDRVDYWLGQGAGVSPTVRSLVSRARAGGDDTVRLEGADPAADAEPEAPAAAGNGAAADAPAEPEAGDDAAADAPAAEAEPDPPAAGTEPAESADAPEAPPSGGDAPEAPPAPEDGDAADPGSGAA